VSDGVIVRKTAKPDGLLGAYRRSTEIQDLTKSGKPQGIANAEAKLAGGPHGAGRRWLLNGKEFVLRKQP
jgi:hypothetical protein